MDNRTIRLFLTAALLTLVGYGQQAVAAEADILQEPPVLDPNIVRLGLDEALIDDENFEVGAYAGFINIENFGTDFFYGIQGAWHVTEDIFFQAQYGFTEVGNTPVEDFADVNLLTSSEREFTFYNLSLGLNLLPGEVFITENWVFNTSIYVLAGGGNLEFLGDQDFALNIGAGVRLLATDAFALHLTFQDIITDKPALLNPLGREGTAHYFHYSMALTYFF